MRCPVVPQAVIPRTVILNDLIGQLSIGWPTKLHDIASAKIYCRLADGITDSTCAPGFERMVRVIIAFAGGVAASPTVINTPCGVGVPPDLAVVDGSVVVVVTVFAHMKAAHEPAWHKQEEQVHQHWLERAIFNVTAGTTPM